MPSTTASVPDLSPEGIARLVAEGAAALAVSADPATNDGTTPPSITPSWDGIAQLTHDLRSPLSSMLLIIDNLQCGKAGPLTIVQDAQLRLLYRATAEAAQLASDALDFARAGTHIIAAPPCPFTCRNMLQAVTALVKPVAEVKALHVRTSGGGDRVYHGNATLVKRVLLNLTTNALKYTERGGVTIEVSELAPSDILFSVTDTGPGLTPTEEAALHAPGPPATVAGGLGLSLCRTLLTSVNSRLEYRRPATGGSIFSFRFTAMK